MHARVVGGQVAEATAHVAPPQASRRANRQHRPEPIAAPPRAHDQLRPVPAHRHHVLEQVGRCVAVGDQDVDAAVVVDVAERRGTAGGDERRRSAAARLHFLEPRPAGRRRGAERDAAQQQIGFGIRIGREGLALQADAAIGLIEIEPAVIVEVHQGHAEAREAPAHHAQAHHAGGIDEERAVVAEIGIGLGVEVHDQQVVVAVVVDVGGVHAHTRLRRAVLIDGHTAGQRRLHEAPIAPIDPQMIRRAVVGDEHVGTPVAVDVIGQHAQAVAACGRDAGFGALISERAVAGVAEEQIRGGRVVVLRRAEIDDAGQAETLALARRLPREIARHEQIQVAVGVGVEERGARAPAGPGHLRRRRNVDEVAAAVVA